MTLNKVPCALLMNDMHVSKDTISEFQMNWNEALAICAERNIPEIIVGGDLWQSRSSQTLDTLIAVKQAIDKAVNNDLGVTIMEGNHDKVNQESIWGYSHIFSERPNVHIVDDFEAIHMTDNVVLYLMSYFPENGSFCQKLDAIITSNIKPSCRNFLYIHQGINGALATSSDKELPTSIFKDFEKVFVGHYHNRCLVAKTNIEYIGSSRQHNFGEDEEKGYTIFFQDGSTEFVKNKANKRYRVIEITPSQLSPEMLIDISNSDQAEGYKTKVKIKCDSTEVSLIDKQKLLDAGVAKIEIITEQTVARQSESHGFDRRFNKEGIKSEYAVFCEKKEKENVEFGLKYLDKIK